MDLYRSTLYKIFKFIKFFIAQANHDIAVSSYDVVDCMINRFDDIDTPMELYNHITEQFDLANITFAFVTATGGSPAVMENLIRRLEPPLHSYPIESRLELALESTEAYSCGSRHIISEFNARLGCELTDGNVLDVVFSDSSEYLNRLVGIFGIAFARGDGMAKARLVKVLESGAKLRSDWTGFMASFLTGFMCIRVKMATKSQSKAVNTYTRHGDNRSLS